MKPAVQYSGPDQRKESRVIVGMMACPVCKGPIYDPELKKDSIKSLGAGLVHRLFECMSETCGWKSTGVSRYERGFIDHTQRRTGPDPKYRDNRPRFKK